MYKHKSSKNSKVKLSYDDLLLRSTDERKQYRRRCNEVKNGVHWGQRKLFLNELLFFSTYWNKQKNPKLIVVYVGAAPGKHIAFLISLFPGFEWHLYDPAKFKIKESKKDGIYVYQQYFTDETAKEWSNKTDEDGNKLSDKIFFISDIRSADPAVVGNKFFEKVVEKDMLQQQNWYNIIKPLQAMFKFRLPYPSNKMKTFKYLDGDVYKQPWGPQTTTETRLIPNGREKVTWDLLKYEEQMFYLNSVVRECETFHKLFDDIPKNGLELSNDFDSNFEILIWSKYLKFVGGPNAVNWTSVSSLSKLLTGKINEGKKKSDWDTLEKMRLNPYRIKARNPYKKTRN